MTVSPWDITIDLAVGCRWKYHHSRPWWKVRAGILRMITQRKTCSNAVLATASYPGRKLWRILPFAKGTVVVLQSSKRLKGYQRGLCLMQQTLSTLSGTTLDGVLEPKRRPLRLLRAREEEVHRPAGRDRDMTRCGEPPPKKHGGMYEQAGIR